MLVSSWFVPELKLLFFPLTFIIPSIDLFSFVCILQMLEKSAHAILQLNSIISMVLNSWYSGVCKVYYLLSEPWKLSGSR